MIKLVFPADLLAGLAKALRRGPDKQFAMVLARPVHVGRKDWRLLAHSIHIPKPDQYDDSSGVSKYPAASFRLPVEKRAQLDGFSIIYCHSHPSDRGLPKFSALDDDLGGRLAEHIKRRIPRVPYLSMVVGAEGYRAKVLNSTEEVEIREVGPNIIRYGAKIDTLVGLTHDRQIRAFGEEGQRAIQDLKIAIVGLGGTGSVVAQQLAHLGVRHFLLIDPKTVDETNLNRLVGATRRDIGRLKVLVGQRTIRRILPTAKVKAVNGDVLQKADGLLLRNLCISF